MAMKFVVLTTFAVSALARQQVGPVQKVTQLLEDMLAKGKKEKHEEEVQFTTYKQFCDDTEVEKTKANEKNTKRINFLQAEIGDKTAHVAKMNKEVQAHNTDIANLEDDTSKAKQVRSQQLEDYETLHQDFSESIDALKRATAVLKEQDYTRSQAKDAASLAQVKAVTQMRLIPENAKKTVDVFLQTRQQPEAHGYEFQSNSVVELFEKLHDEFVAKRTALEKKEANLKHSHQMMVQDLAGQIAQASSDIDFKTDSKAKAAVAVAEAKGELDDTTALLESDKAFLKDLKATCQVKAADFASRQKLRAEEISAISQAIEIISSDKVTGSAGRHLRSLSQTAASLVQLRSTEAQMKTRNVAASMLRLRAEAQKSTLLSHVASAVLEDPFRKVKEMVQDLIARLQKQATEDAEKYGWCNTELSKNERTRKDKTDSVEGLHVQIDELESAISKLNAEIKDLTDSAAQLSAEMQKSTELYTKEQQTMAQTIKEAAEGQAAVAQALSILRDFYERAGEATALVQAPKQPEAPEIFDSAYTGMQSENGGVIGFLEVIQSDFSVLERETTKDKETSTKEYNTFMTESSQVKAEHVTAAEHNTRQKVKKTGEMQSARQDLEATQTELDAALLAYDKLKPVCITTGGSFEDRVADRRAEIQSLQEALKILSGDLA